MGRGFAHGEPEGLLVLDRLPGHDVLHGDGFDHLILAVDRCRDADAVHRHAELRLVLRVEALGVDGAALPQRTLLLLQLATAALVARFPLLFEPRRRDTQSPGEYVDFTFTWISPMISVQRCVT